MKYRKLGRTDISISVEGFGMWAAGTASFSSEADDESKLRTLEKAIDEGITLFDTAPLYGFGHAEELLGKAIAGKREQVIVATKCGLWWESKDRDFAFERDGKKIYRSLTPEHIRQELENSLRRLKTDYIDIYLTHWPERGENATPIAVTMDALLKLKKEGKIRAIGACNVTLADIQAYQAVGQLDVIQNHYSMLERDSFESGVISIQDWVLDQNIAMMAWSPLERGVLTGKYGMDYVPNNPNERYQSVWYEEKHRHYLLGVLDSWEDLLKKYDCSITQLVLAWTIARSGITSVLVGARKVPHLKENLLAANIILSIEDKKRMDNDIQHTIQHFKTNKI